MEADGTTKCKTENLATNVITSYSPTPTAED